MRGSTVPAEVSRSRSRCRCDGRSGRRYARPVRRRSGSRPPTPFWRRAPNPTVSLTSVLFRSRVRRLIISSTIVAFSRLGRGSVIKPLPKIRDRRRPRRHSQLAGRNQSQNVSDQCGVSLVRPGPVDHSSTGVSSLEKTRSPLFPEQFHAGLAGGFCDVLQQGTSKRSQFA